MDIDERLIGVYPNLAIPPGVPARVVKDEPKRTYDEYARMLDAGEFEEVDDDSDR